MIKANFALSMEKEWKEDNSPLTATDTVINNMVINAVKEAYPEYGLITEEGGGNYLGQEYAWVCDPVDGTIPFSHGVPTCTFMLALTKNGESILGVVYDPFADHMYYAAKGEGAFMDGNKIKVSNTKSLDKSVVGLVMWREAKFQLTKMLPNLLDKGVIDFRIPSIGYLDMLVANGEFVAAIHPGAYSWDSAAPKIIVEEAGGKFTDLLGKNSDYTKEVDGHLASNGVLHEELLQMIRESLE